MISKSTSWESNKSIASYYESLFVTQLQSIHSFQIKKKKRMQFSNYIIIIIDSTSVYEI